MIFITSSFDMDWPDTVINFMNGLAIVVEAQKAIVSFDCFIEARKLVDYTQFFSPSGEWRMTYSKLILNASLPIFCGISSITIWYIILKHQGKIT
mmetsp:Transcript_25292/g.39109  ORF Transcript_25292/g.39109 Transcript_25292/m.39109 type:complete len:95 (+) Transcript_25292:3824-4108(+)